jgi:thiamine pyrophosphate-dependent acetolactate synthase large subunit-like protein
MTRYEALKAIAQHFQKDDLAVVALGGMIDEWHSLKPEANSMYLKIMGSITPVAFGIADALRHRRVLSLDTDGSLLLNLGILCTIGNEQPENLVVIVMDNECYEVIGSPPTHTSGNVDLAAMARGAGIENAVSVENTADLEKAYTKALAGKEPALIVAKVDCGTQSFPEEQRKRTEGHEDKYRFVRYIEDTEGATIIPREVKSIRKVTGTATWNLQG